MRTTVNQGSNVLVVYYSRTGMTRRVATEIAALGQWDLEPVIDMKPRNNLFGYTRSMFDSLFGRSTELAAPRHNPAEYELVIVGTPVWNGSVSAPIRTWLQDWAGRLPHARVLCHREAPWRRARVSPDGGACGQHADHHVGADGP